MRKNVVIGDAEGGAHTLVTRLNQICRTATFGLAYQVGELIVRELFDGDIVLWQREGTRRPSYRELAKNGDLMLSPSALCRAVSVYALSERLGGCDKWRHLSVSHLQEVLSLPECEQEKLLESAEMQGWSVVRLRAEARGARASRVPAPSLVPALRRLKAHLCAYSHVLHAEEQVLTKAAEREVRQTIELLQRQASSLQELLGSAHFEDEDEDEDESEIEESDERSLAHLAGA
jgi:hypothetical protein